MQRCPFLIPGICKCSLTWQRGVKITNQLVGRLAWIIQCNHHGPFKLEDGSRRGELGKEM